MTLSPARAIPSKMRTVGKGSRGNGAGRRFGRKWRTRDARIRFSLRGGGRRRGEDAAGQFIFVFAKSYAR